MSALRTREERLAAVKKRARALEAKRSRRRGRVLGFSALAVSLLVILGLSLAMPSVMARLPRLDYTTRDATASVFDVSRSLGYILVAGLAFLLGVVLTILFYRIQIRDKRDQGGKDA